MSIESEADLQKLVDGGIEESLTLEYKSSAALTKDDKKRDEMCKDVSAMANSAGGQIIYGIEETGHKPSRVDEGTSAINREWIEQVLNSRISPRIEGLLIKPIQLKSGFGYVVTVPQASSRAPHQAPDHRYYRRYNFQAVPMADYEIRDMLRRSSTPDLEVTLTLNGRDSTQLRFLAHQEVSETVTLLVGIRNHSPAPAHFVVNDVAIDTELMFPHDGASAFRRAGTLDEPPLSAMAIFRRAISSPPDIPIFKESPDLRQSRILFQVPSALLHSRSLPVSVAVQTPGFESRKVWALYSNQGTLWLLPPGDRRNPYN